MPHAKWKKQPRTRTTTRTINNKNSALTSMCGDWPRRARGHAWPRRSSGGRHGRLRSPEEKRGLAPERSAGACPHFSAAPTDGRLRSPGEKRGLAPERSAGACPRFSAAPTDGRLRSPGEKRGLAPERSAGACPRFSAARTEGRLRSPEEKRGLAPERSAGACPHFSAAPTDGRLRSPEGAQGNSRGRKPLSLPTSSIRSAAMRPCRSRITTAAPAGACSQGDCLPRACRSAFGGSPAPWAKHGNPPSAGATAGRRISARLRRATVLSPGRDAEGGEPWVCGSVSQQAPSGATVGCRSAASPANRHLPRCGQRQGRKPPVTSPS